MDKKIGSKDIGSKSTGNTETKEHTEEISVKEDVLIADEPRQSGWFGYKRLRSVKSVYDNPFNRRVVLLTEARVPEGKDFIRVVAGRVEVGSPVGVARQFFYEDIPHVVNDLIALYEDCADHYVAFEEARIKRSVDNDLAAVKNTVSHNREDWVGRLNTIKDRIAASFGES